MSISAFACKSCGIEVKGRFCEPRLARLPPDMQRLAELFLVNGGNLKLLAPALNLSYPTLRKRIDTLVGTLRDLQEADKRQIASWLSAVELGQMTAEEAARLIRESNGES